MKDDKTIGEALSSVKDIKVSSIRKLIHNIWKLAVFAAMCFFFVAAGMLTLHRGFHFDDFFVCLFFGSVAAFDFFTGKLTAFIFKDRM
jgi:hypothetical protein